MTILSNNPQQSKSQKISDDQVAKEVFRQLKEWNVKEITLNGKIYRI